MYVKDLVRILKKYKDLKKDLNDLKKSVLDGDTYLSKSEWKELLEFKHKEYIDFLHTKIEDLLED